MSALVDEAGKFRHGGVGVFAGKQAVHIAPPAERVPTLIADLFDWLKHAEDHLLIRSCVFHKRMLCLKVLSSTTSKSAR